MKYQKKEDVSFYDNDGLRIKDCAYLKGIENHLNVDDIKDFICGKLSVESLVSGLGALLIVNNEIRLYYKKKGKAYLFEKYLPIKSLKSLTLNEKIIGGAKLVIQTQNKDIIVNFPHKYNIGYDNNNKCYIRKFADNLLIINPSIRTNCDTKNYLKQRDPNLLELVGNRNIINFIEGDNEKKGHVFAFLMDNSILFCYPKSSTYKEVKYSNVADTKLSIHTSSSIRIFYDEEIESLVNIQNIGNASKFVSDVENLRRFVFEQKALKAKEILSKMDIGINIPDKLEVGINNPIKVTVKNMSDTFIEVIDFKTNFPELILCENKSVTLDKIEPNSNKFTAFFINPRLEGEFDLGVLDYQVTIDEHTFEGSAIGFGTHEAIKPVIGGVRSMAGLNSDISITREAEFYQGFIRLKIAVNNESELVVNDLFLELNFETKLLRIDDFEPDYSIENDKIKIGNINAKSSKSISIYLEPLICTKGTDINCYATYKNARGELCFSKMKTKQISVTCPIMHTENSINVGVLKQLTEKHFCKDSRVYQIHDGFNTEKLVNLSREVVQKHNVKHVRTLKTKDGRNYEIWYYGKTKVKNHDVVIKIALSSQNQSIEIFASTHTHEMLAGILAEIGREIKTSIESINSVNNNVQQIINVSIRDSIIQRSNLLSSCDINGNCTGEVVIVDSVVQGSEIGMVNANVCKNCGKGFDEEARFCSGCGSKIISSYPSLSN